MHGPTLEVFPDGHSEQSLIPVRLVHCGYIGYYTYLGP